MHLSSAWRAPLYLLIGVTASPPATAAAPIAITAAAPAAALAFTIRQGDDINRFVRVGQVAAHLVLRAGREPRLLVVFPAGDSGEALWFAPQSRPVRWQVLAAPLPVTGRDAQGRPLWGIQMDLAVNATRLTVREALLSSVRVLRDYVASGSAPRQVQVDPQRTATMLSWSRTRLDGAPGFRLSVQVLEGARATANGFSALSGRTLQLRVRALCGAQPLIGLSATQLLTTNAGRDRREREVLAFLSYRQKYLAGSWRFDTYFGRDTLLALMMLAPVLQASVMQSGLESVLARLSPQGEVAHEEAIGEYAILLNEAAGRGDRATPVYDYGMIDESFLLAPLAAQWLLGASPGSAAEFLNRHASGERNGDLLMRNLRFVVHRTAGFAIAPRISELIGLKRGHRAGDWRDSPDGLEGGVYPYDVNVALVPAALAAIARLAASPLLSPYLRAGDRALLARAASQRRVWVRQAPHLFAVSIAVSRACADVSQYAASLGLNARPALRALGAGPLHFDAVALDTAGRALPIMQSDEGFALLLDQPSPGQLRQDLDTLLRPFPAGLLTPAGLLVANPAYAGAPAQALFTRMAYHGTVVWAWQQTMLAAGLARQLQRRDLPADLIARLRSARRQLWRVITAGSAYRGAELWSWSYRQGRWQIAPFQPASGDAEADAAQLWSTVLLALRRPAASAASAAGIPQRVDRAGPNRP